MDISEKSYTQIPHRFGDMDLLVDASPVEHERVRRLLSLCEIDLYQGHPRPRTVSIMGSGLPDTRPEAPGVGANLVAQAMMTYNERETGKKTDRGNVLQGDEIQGAVPMEEGSTREMQTVVSPSGARLTLYQSIIQNGPGKENRVGHYFLIASQDPVRVAETQKNPVLTN